jgi:hypothetical protein
MKKMQHVVIDSKPYQLRVTEEELERWIAEHTKPHE